MTFQQDPEHEALSLQWFGKVLVGWEAYARGGWWVPVGILKKLKTNKTFLEFACAAWCLAFN